MAIVAYYDLKSHHMGVKTTFMNREVDEKIHMKQPEGFEVSSSVKQGFLAHKIIV